MAARRIVIVTPAAPGSRSGNRNTAVRWSRILRGLGFAVDIMTAWDGRPCELFVALHARRSHDSLAAFRRAHPGIPTILALTGTDLYRDIRVSDEARESLALADRFIVLQELGDRELDPALRPRANVIHQSETARHPWAPPKRVFRLCVLGHLREEKDPFRAALALAHLPQFPRLQLVQAGKPLSDDMEREARRLMETDSRYRWIGEVAHWQALRLMARSHAMIISSRMEGGAHVVSEAIAQGVPVIASDINGNRGMLGADYPGYYPVEDERTLAALIGRAASDPAFLQALCERVRARRSLIDPAREVSAWRTLLAALAVGRT
jgi:putative glycosyltransferase (TIGR04348 family)